jgi:hypothetical protein
MSLPNEVNLHHLGSTGYTINQSLRFRASASARLSRTPATTTNRKLWTWSAWVKRGNLATGIDQVLFRAVDGSANFNIVFSTSNRILVESGATNLFNTTPVYRDPSAWYHVVVAFDSDNGTEANRCIVYVNGVSQAKISGSVSSGTQVAVNTANPHYIGASPDDRFYDGYMAEINFIDGSALTPSSFGQADSQTGVWQPKKYGGSYGTNGFYLNFSDNSAVTAAALGKDSSGNGNNWTPTNFSLTAGSTYDWMRDSPTVGALASNHCTLNALNKFSGSTVRSGGLQVVHGSSGDGWCTTGSTFAFPETGKWYAEFFITSRAFSGTVGIGISEANRSFVSQSGDTARFAWGRVYFDNASTFIGPNNGTTGSVATYTTGDTIGLAFDSDNGKVWWSKNGTWYGTGASPDPATGVSAAYTGLTRAAYPMGFVATCEGYSGSITDANFGQRPFTYTPPTGFKTLNTFNLPTPTIGATSATRASKNFDATLYTGNGSTQTLNNSAGFYPDFNWFKVRSSTGNHVLVDSVRGGTKQLFSSLTDAEQTNTNITNGISSSGIVVGSNVDGTGSTNQNSFTYVLWQWLAGAGSSVNNTSGSITSQVSANPSAGFSIVTYTGTGSSATVGHGLGVAPNIVIFKRRNSGDSWPMYHSSLGAAASIVLNNSNASNGSGGTYYWDGNAPTSSVFSVAYDSAINASGSTYVAYCWSQIAGYSAFGSYTGNGSTDGPFVHTGFEPAFVMTKKSNSSGNWYMSDNKRIISGNGDTGFLYAEQNVTESDYGESGIDFLANGFKIRNTDSSDNGSGDTMIYMAYAETPFKYTLAR